MSRHRSYGDISEAESERSAASFVSLKRSFSQTSVAPSSSRLTTSGTATPVTATRTPDEKEADLAAVRVSRSGTWPLRRQKSAAGAQELGNQLDLWDMQVRESMTSDAARLAPTHGASPPHASLSRRSVHSRSKRNLLPARPHRTHCSGSELSWPLNWQSSRA